MGSNRKEIAPLNLNGGSPESSAEAPADHLDQTELTSEQAADFEADLSYLLSQNPSLETMEKPDAATVPAKAGDNLEASPSPVLGLIQRDANPAEKTTPGTQNTAPSPKKQGVDSLEKGKPRPSARSLKEVLADLDEITFSSDDEVAEKKEKRVKPKKEKKVKDKKEKEQKEQGKTEKTEVAEKTENQAEDKVEPSEKPTESDEAANTAGKPKRPKRKRTKKKKVDTIDEEKASEPKEPSEATAPEGSLQEKALEPQGKPGPSEKNPDITFGLHLSARATRKTQLTEVTPVNTIIGLSHEQIFRTKLTDVKIKILVNSPMSRMCRIVLGFVMDEHQGLFCDEQRQRQFVELCVHVALHELNGFNAISTKYPEILEWAPQYPALTLEHTKTTLTVSTRQAHRNLLDYTVFLFIGHVLVWASGLQRRAHMETYLEKYTLLTPQHVQASMGGDHLWDKLRKDPKINLKRWKHIQKFRQIFAFEELQFVLVLRCMNLGLSVP